MGRLTGVVVATPDPSTLRNLLETLTDSAAPEFDLAIVQTDRPSPAMALSVDSDDLEKDVADCQAAGYGERWRADGGNGQTFVMTSEASGASILLVQR